MDPEKFAKVLAMAESDHQGEALSALRAARIMLARSGLSFRDLALSMSSTGDIRDTVHAAPPAYSPPADQLVAGLRRQVSELEQEVTVLKRQLDRQKSDLERQREEALRWRTLARQTAERLWDLGKALERYNMRQTLAEKRRAVLDALQDPQQMLLTDREIARRIGASPQSVAEWRRRLALMGRKLRLLPVVRRGRGVALYQRPVTPDTPRHRWDGVVAEWTRGIGPAQGTRR